MRLKDWGKGVLPERARLMRELRMETSVGIWMVRIGSGWEEEPQPRRSKKNTG
jgi:hypothetical protein